MSKGPSPLLGYNNNVRHKNKIFHIQTEDSGVKYGHIITHLFMDGGRILKSTKTSYADYIGHERMTEIVREMMKQQHKAMFVALRDGQFDDVVEGKVTSSPSSSGMPAVTPTSAPATKAPSSTTTPAADPPRAQGDRVGRRATPTRVRATTPPPAKPPSPRPEPDTELTLDIEALERAAAAAEQASSQFKATSELPPPPTNLFREKSAIGHYRTIPQAALENIRRVRPASSPPGEKRPSRPPSRPSNRPVRAGTARPINGAAPRGTAAPPPVPAPAPKPSLVPVKEPSPPAGSPPAERRFAPTRPASIFGQARPQQGKTIFGEDLISDKSLDEVILSYLADDLEPPTEKK